MNLMDRAYMIATGIVTTERMGYNEWQDCKTEDYMVEQFEHLGEHTIEELVTQIAEDIIQEFKDE